MARQRSTGDDSLELLLDTICNMFGGIVLIAILLAVIAQESGGKASSPDKPRVPDDVRKTQDARLAFLSNEIARADQFLLGSTSNSVTPNEVTAEEINKIKAVIAKLSSDCGTEQTVQTEIGAKVDKIKIEIANLEKQQKAAPTRNVRVPTAHEVPSSTVFGLFKNNVYFPLTDMSSTGSAKNRSFNQTICLVKQGIMSGLPMIHISLRKDAVGQLIEGGFSTTGHISELVKNIDIKNEVVFFVVYADSFGAFNKVKEFLVAQGIGYSWMPLAMNQQIPPVIPGKAKIQN